MKKVVFGKKIFFFIAALAAAALSCNLVTSFVESTKLRFSPDTLPDGQVGQAYKAVISLSNQHTPAFRMDAKDESLPPGLKGTFDKDQQTYTIEGTPTQAGTFSLTVSALCYGTNVSGQSGEKEYTLVIK